MYQPRWHDSYPASRLPRPPAPAISPAAFVAVPIGGLPAASAAEAAGRYWLYQVALDQAREAARPALVERNLLSFWN
jgi:hypothetical protein